MQSESITNLTKALIEAQLELQNPDKNTQGYGYKYADLASILDLVKPVLKKYHLAISQLAGDDGNGKVGVTTILMHESGEYLSSTLYLPIPDMASANSTQRAGASITYARRYSLSAILNISADEDTDGTTDKPKAKASAKKSTTTTTKELTSQQERDEKINAKTTVIKALYKAVADQGGEPKDDLIRIAVANGRGSIGSFTKEELDELLDEVKSKGFKELMQSNA